MIVPVYKSDYRRTHFKNCIAYKPTQIRFRGNDITARLEEPSYSSRLQNYGVDRQINFECMIALEIGDPKPEERKDSITIGNDRYDIENVNADSGPGCYHLELRYKGPIK